ncbi:hypothetical protein [Flavobacterium sp.]
MRQKILILIFIFCIFLLACSKKNEQAKLSNIVIELVDSLSISDKSMPNIVFISDDYPKARNYKSYHKFMKITTEDELKELTHHKKPNIRCYAFNGLVEKKSSGLRKIFEEHIKDTAQIHLSYGGCVVIETTVMKFMLDQLHPFGSKSPEKFSRKEYDEYIELAEKYRKEKASH